MRGLGIGHWWGCYPRYTVSQLEGFGVFDIFCGLYGDFIGGSVLVGDGCSETTASVTVLI
jgi:hypothetical protein